MTTLLETLWCFYQKEKPAEQGKARQRLFEEMISYEGEGSFTEKQIELLTQLWDCREGLAEIDEYEAFAKGVRFATQYLLEAMGKQ